VTENATNYKTARATIPYVQPDRSVASGGQWCPAPPFVIGAPPFHVWPPGCCIHPILYFKNVPPFLFFCPSIWFLALLLLNLGDGPATRDEISQPCRPISPRAATVLTDDASQYFRLLEVKTVRGIGQQTFANFRTLIKFVFVDSGY